MKPTRKPIIGIMGPGSPDDPELSEYAQNLGRAIAEKDWILLTGGRAAGVMDAASKGASESGGITLGILPGSDKNEMSEFVQIPIFTDMGHARNVINILTSDVIVVCGMGAGTASEAALALKTGTPLITTRISPEDLAFLNRLTDKQIPSFDKLEAVIDRITQILLLEK
jgi:uncharacterized protein (TIGR00725 family)